MTEATSGSRYLEFKYGWKVVVASAVGIALGMSPLPFYTIGVFQISYTAEFGWSRGMVLLGLTVFTLCAVPLAPTIGNLADRFGVRRVVLLAIPGLSIGLMAMALNNGSYPLYLTLWGLLAILGIGTLPITFTRAVNRWFHDCRGLALGCALIGTGLAGWAAIKLVGWLIPLVGWRWAYVCLGAVPMLIAFPIVYFFFFDVDNERVQDKVAALKRERSTPVTLMPGGLTLSEAFRDWRLWLLIYAFLPISFVIAGPIPGIVDIMMSKEFTRAEAITLGSIVPFAVFFGRLIGGYLIDKIWAPLVSMVILSLPMVFCFLLRLDDPGFYTIALANISLGFAAGVEYDLLAFLVSRYFGLKAYSSIYGVIYVVFALGAGFAPGLYGFSADRFGDYDFVLGIALLATPLFTVPLLALGKYREFPPEDDLEPSPSQ